MSDNMQIGNNFFFASLVGFRKCLPLVFVMACWLESGFRHGVFGVEHANIYFQTKHIWTQKNVESPEHQGIDGQNVALLSTFRLIF